MDDEGQRQTLDLVTRYDGPWDEREVARFLMRTKTPMRLAVNTPSGLASQRSTKAAETGSRRQAAGR